MFEGVEARACARGVSSSRRKGTSQQWGEDVSYRGSPHDHECTEVSKVTVTVWAAEDDPVAGRSREGSPSLFAGLSHAFVCPAMRDETGWATCMLGPQRTDRRKK